MIELKEGMEIKKEDLEDMLSKGLKKSNCKILPGYEAYRTDHACYLLKKTDENYQVYMVNRNINGFH